MLDGLSVIPGESRLSKAIRDVMGIWTEDPHNWRSCHKMVLEKYGSYSWLHTIPNACFVTMGILHGYGNLEKSIGIAVHCGMDTDCNDATVGSVVGAMPGFNGNHTIWTGPLHDTVESTLATMRELKLSELAKRTLAFVAGQ